MKKKHYMIKGEYEHSQIGGYFSVKEFIMLEEQGKHCLLLRFQNEMKTPVHAVEFIVKQLNADGKIIKSVRIRYTDLQVEAGQRYCASNGIVLEDSCADCVVLMRYVISGRNKYIFKRGLVTAHYDFRGYQQERNTESLKNEMIVKRAYSGAGRKLFAVIAILSLFLSVAALALLIG